MAHYLVGDLQGDLYPLEKLLEYIEFDSKYDFLWAAGDLVNRGTQSVEVLRYFYKNQRYCNSVLGNHDLHLLTIATGIRPANPKDTLDEVLQASDCEELMLWLRARPLIQQLDDGLLVHAGIPPLWDSDTAIACAEEMHQALISNDYRQALIDLYGDCPIAWHEDIDGAERKRLICNFLTRMRFCDTDGGLVFDAHGSLDKTPKGAYPWFAHPQRRCREQNIYFGHWAALKHNHPSDNSYALDGGWIWGNQLRVLRLEDKTLYECQKSDLSIAVKQIQDPL